MKFFPIILFFIFEIITSTLTKRENPIKNVVVLMMENRSFDHMLGWMTKGGKYGNPKVDGLTGKECNHVNSNFAFLG